MKTGIFILIAWLQILFAGSETDIKEIALKGYLKKAKAQVSGMAWAGDNLVLLPQYPGKYIYSIPKQKILDYISNNSDEALKPDKIRIHGMKRAKALQEYEGFEAIVFQGEEVYMTVETHMNTGYVISGLYSEADATITLQAQSEELQPSQDINNMAFESLLLFEDHLLALYEANGANVNNFPWAGRLTKTLSRKKSIPFPNIEYRITDATMVEDGKFWAINYFWPGDKKRLKPAKDMLADMFGEGETHSKKEAVERLLEFKFENGKIVFSGQPPIQLKLKPGKNSRNWEGIVRLDDLGFLLITDEHPGTILGFLPYPKSGLSKTKVLRE